MASIIQKKRFSIEVKLLMKQPLHYCTAYPDENNPLIWYFLIKGQKNTDYHTCKKNKKIFKKKVYKVDNEEEKKEEEKKDVEDEDEDEDEDEENEDDGFGGEYIGKIVHSFKYPVEPPDYYMLTPSGRFNINNKICLTNSSYHRGDWSSTWNIITILIAFCSIWVDDIETGISHIKDTKKNRKKMAAKSIEYNIKNYYDIYNKFDRSNLSDDVPIKLEKKDE
jgi:ubiquitin-protein ligase